MKKRLIIFLCSIFAIVGLLFPSQNTSAIPPTDNQDTTITTPSTTNPQTTQDQNAQDTNDTSPQDDNAAATTDAACYDQVGGIGWLLCPVTGTLAKGIDAIYGIIEGFLRVSPISTAQDSPIYLVWEYIRNITNIIFIIFLLVVIFSQLTDLGINNYGIKKVAPRIIIAAIFVNLSYIICALAVDASNILGSSLGAIFDNIYTVATAGETATYNIGTIVSTILGTVGVGTGVTIGALAITGGIGAALWMLLPVIFAGAIAVISALITMAARQALIIILIMIAPLAFVAYLLPNTEKWFTKWKDLLLQMLIFYPMFTVLFSASQLASWVIISSAANVFGVILGIAVQVLPLFFSLSLMKMSNTILGKINTGIQKLTTKAQGGVTDYAGSQRQLLKERHQKLSNMPSARLARFMADRQIRRKQDTDKYKDANDLRGKAFAASSVYDRNGKLTKRGQRLYALERDLSSTNAIEKVRQDFDKGLNSSVARSKRQARYLDAINAQIGDAVDDKWILEGRGRAITRENIVSAANRLDAARKGLPGSNDLKQKLTAYAKSLSEGQPQTDERVSSIFAHAIQARDKVDVEATAMYRTLFQNTEWTPDIQRQTDEAFAIHNYNAVKAGIAEMEIRGDGDLIDAVLFKYANRQAVDSTGKKIWDLTMQKQVTDSMLGFKGDFAYLSQFSKSSNIRRGKQLEPAQFADYITGTAVKQIRYNTDGDITGYEAWDMNSQEYRDHIRDIMQGQTGERPTEAKLEERLIKERQAYKDLSASTLIGTINNSGIAATQDRNNFKRIMEFQMAGLIEPKEMLFQLKQMRSGMVSGNMDGEQLGNANKLMTGGFSGINAEEDARFMKDDNELADLVARHQITQKTADDIKKQRAFYHLNFETATKEQIIPFLRDAVPEQIASMRGTSFCAMLTSLNYYDDQYTEKKNVVVTAEKDTVDPRLLDYLRNDLLKETISMIKKNRNTLNRLHPTIKALLID